MTLYPIYTPAPHNPAIFPMHRDGAMVPATQPSRGGTDLLRDGKRRVNKPRPLEIPSAGLGAPQTNEEIDEAIRRYLKDRHAAARKAEEDWRAQQRAAKERKRAIPGATMPSR